MLGGQNEVLLEIERMIHYHKYQEADLELDALEKRGNLSKEEELRSDTLRSLVMRQVGKWQEGLELIEQITEESKEFENKLIFLDALIVKVSFLTDIQRYDDVITITETGIRITEKEDSANKEYNLRKAWFLVYKGIQQNAKGEYDNAQEILEEGMTLAKELDDDHLFISLCQINHLNEATRGELQKAANHLKKALKKSLEIQNDIASAYLYSSIAEISQFMGKFKQGLENLEEALKIYQEYGLPTLELEFLKAVNYWSSGLINEGIEIYKRLLPQIEEAYRQNPRLQCFYFWNKAMVEWYEGNLDKAIELIEEAYNIGLELGNRYLIMGYSALLGNLLLDSNQIERVKELSLASLENYKDLHFPVYKSLNYENLGRTFQIKGDINFALEYLEKSLKLRRESDMFYQAIRILFHLINVAIDKNDEELYNKYLVQMKEFHHKEPKKSTDQFYRISRALVLKASNLHKNRKSAIEILVNVSKEEIHYYPLKVIILINLCELFMNEFSLARDIEVLEELEKYTKELEMIANSQKQTSYTLRIEAKNIQLLTVWLKAQHLKNDENLERAKILLDEAREIANSEGLIRLAEKIKNQHDKLYKQIIQ